MFDGELIKSHIVVQRLDRPVAPIPHRPHGIALIAVRIRIARSFQPLPHHALAVARAREQFIHKRNDCGVLFRSIAISARAQKLIHFRGRRRQTGEVEIKSATKFIRRSLRRRRESFAELTREHKRINRVLRPFAERGQFSLKLIRQLRVTLVQSRNSQLEIRNSR